jgi:hypothetical protein
LAALTPNLGLQSTGKACLPAISGAYGEVAVSHSHDCGGTSVPVAHTPLSKLLACPVLPSRGVFGFDKTAAAAAMVLFVRGGPSTSWAACSKKHNCLPAISRGRFGGFRLHSHCGGAIVQSAHTPLPQFAACGWLRFWQGHRCGRICRVCFCHPVGLCSI